MLFERERKIVQRWAQLRIRRLVGRRRLRWLVLAGLLVAGSIGVLGAGLSSVRWLKATLPAPNASEVASIEAAGNGKFSGTVSGDYFGGPLRLAIYIDQSLDLDGCRMRVVQRRRIEFPARSEVKTVLVGDFTETRRVELGRDAMISVRPGVHGDSRYANLSADFPDPGEHNIHIFNAIPASRPELAGSVVSEVTGYERGRAYGDYHGGEAVDDKAAPIISRSDDVDFQVRVQGDAKTVVRALSRVNARCGGKSQIAYHDR